MSDFDIKELIRRNLAAFEGGVTFEELLSAIEAEHPELSPASRRALLFDALNSMIASDEIGYQINYSKGE